MSGEVQAVNKVNASRDDGVDVDPNLNAVADEYEEAGEFADEAKKEPELSPRDQIAKDFQDKNRQFKDDGSNDEPVNKNDSDTANNADTLKTEQPEMVTIKVNGRDIEVEQDKIDKAGGVQAYQKEVAVMQGFKDVAYQKKGLDAREADLAQREETLLKTQTALPALDETDGKTNTNSNTSDLPTGDQKPLSRLITKHREALLDGDDEQADSLMTQMLSIRETPALDSDAIAEQAAKKSVTIMQERDRNNAIHMAQNDLLAAHPELTTDSRLYTAVDDETNAVQKEFPHYTPTQILNEAYSRVNEWRGGNQQDKAVNTAIDKVNEKRSINRPRVSTGRAQAPQAPRRDTNSEYIAKMRKSRGLDV